MGGIISAWNMRVVGLSLRVSMARAMSLEDTAGNSSTYECQLATQLTKQETYTRLAQESFKSSNTSFNKRSQLISITRNNTSIKSNINPALSPARPQLLLTPTKSGRRRNSIQRHINNGSDTTASSSTGTSPEALPLRTTRLVQVNMSVDETGQEKLRSMVDVLCTSREA